MDVNTEMHIKMSHLVITPMDLTGAEINTEQQEDSSYSLRPPITLSLRCPCPQPDEWQRIPRKHIPER